MPDKSKNAAAVELGRKGGRNTRKYMTPEQASAVARANATKGWEKRKQQKDAA